MARLVPIAPAADMPLPQQQFLLALQRDLEPAWTVVHDAAWVGRPRRHAPLQDGRADFVLAHPERGLFVLQWQPGSLLWEPSKRVWLRPDAQHEVVPDPFVAAETGLEVLLGKLAEHPLASPSRPTTGFGVVVPDVLTPPRGLAPHAPAEICLDREALRAAAKAVEVWASAWQSRRGGVGNAPSYWWWQAFEDVFVAPRQARALLRHRIADEQAHMIALSPQQMAVLDLLQRVRRQAVYGPAGTGKTLLAMHKARMLARQGMRVLLTCYNKALGHYLRQSLADVPGVVAGHFHDLCYDLAELDRDKVKPPQGHKLGSQQFFDHDLAGLLQRVGEERGGAFDALVVDEAQDFLAPWWTALDAWLVEPTTAIRYLFYDDAQRLRPDAAPVAGAEGALTLTTNWRNTQAIHRHLQGIEPAFVDVHCVAPQGLPVQMESLRPNRGKALRRILHRLVGDGGVDPADIVVLTGRSAQTSAIHDFAQELLPFRLTTTEEPGHVRLQGIGAYKGMESPVVILTELAHLDPARAQRLHYIGGSRATNLLIVLEDAAVGAEAAG